jgi:hypothetical protein
MRASGKGQRRVADMTHGLDVDHQVVGLRRLAKVPLAELSEAMVHRALLMAADMIEKLAAEVAAAAWKEEQERRRGSLSTAHSASVSSLLRLPDFSVGLRRVSPSSATAMERAYFALDRRMLLTVRTGCPDFSAMSRSCPSIAARAGASPSSPPRISRGTLRFDRCEPSA